MATSRLGRLFGRGRDERADDGAPPAYTGIGAPRQYDPPPGAPGHGTAGYRPVTSTAVATRFVNCAVADSLPAGSRCGSVDTMARTPQSPPSTVIGAPTPHRAPQPAKNAAIQPGGPSNRSMRAGRRVSCTCMTTPVPATMKRDPIGISMPGTLQPPTSVASRSGAKRRTAATSPPKSCPTSAATAENVSVGENIFVGRMGLGDGPLVHYRDVNRRGISFLTPHRLPLGYGGLLDVQTPDGRLISIHCTLIRCREAAPGWFEAGGLGKRVRTARGVS